MAKFVGPFNPPLQVEVSPQGFFTPFDPWRRNCFTARDWKTEEIVPFTCVMGEVVEIGIVADGIMDDFHWILNEYNMGVSGVVEMEGHALRVIGISKLAEDGSAFILTKDLLNMKPIHFIGRL